MEILFELEYEEDNPFGDDFESDKEFLLSIYSKKYPLASQDDILSIASAFEFCHHHHRNVIRKSGKPYYTHPLRVAIILIQEFPYSDVQSVCACLLHDTIEDVKDVDYELVSNKFGQDVAGIVDGVTKISFEDSTKEINKAHTYRKIFMSLIKDIRVILIKLADRLHNMRTLHYLSENKQKLIAEETLNFYTPLAHKLGLSRVKMELENLSFYFIDQATYSSIRDALTKKRLEFLSYIKIFTDHIDEALDGNNVSHTLSIVHKHEYEIYKIMQEGKSLSDITNFYSIVIILDSVDVKDCYTAHGILANAFNSINFIDYISNPRIDWYKSLYSEIYGPDGRKVEILIRTSEMEKIAEEGFASVYKLGEGRIRALNINDEQSKQWANWMEEMIESRGEEAIQIIWDSIKVNIFDSELTIYEKDGNVRNLPQGSSVLDYAFSLSNEDGLHCVSGKINGIVRDIAYKLNNGDQVEIIKSLHSYPKPDWHKFVVSNPAVIGIYNYFKSQLVSVNFGTSKENEYKLRILGEDREEMLRHITEAIGQTNMQSINIDSTGKMFDGIISLHTKNKAELNLIFAELFKVDGIRWVSVI